MTSSILKGAAMATALFCAGTSQAHADQYLSCTSSDNGHADAVIDVLPVLGARAIMWNFGNAKSVRFDIREHTAFFYKAIEANPAEPTRHREIEMSRTDGRTTIFELVKGDSESQIVRDYCEKRITERQCGEQMQAHGFNPFSCYSCLEWRGEFRISHRETYVCERVQQKF